MWIRKGQGSPDMHACHQWSHSMALGKSVWLSSSLCPRVCLPKRHSMLDSGAPIMCKLATGHPVLWWISPASLGNEWSLTSGVFFFFFLVSVQFVQFQERLVHSFPSTTHTPLCSARSPSCHGLDSWCPVGRLAFWARLQLHRFSVCSPAHETGGGQTDRRHIALDWSGCWQQPLRLGGHICKGGHGRHSHDRATRWQRALRALRALPGSYGSSSGSILLLLKRKAPRRQKIPSFNSYNDPVMVYITDGKRRLEDTKYVIWGHTTVTGLTVDNCMQGAQSSTWHRQSNRQHFLLLLKEPSDPSRWHLSRSPTSLSCSY